jgi:hypothetical protein
MKEASRNSRGGAAAYRVALGELSSCRGRGAGDHSQREQELCGVHLLKMSKGEVVGADGSD